MTSMFASVAPMGLAVGAATVIIYSGFKYIKNKKENTIPESWNKVGVISDIFCFPIKSCGPLRVKEAECQILGLRIGSIRDRTFMIIQKDGNFLTARQQPSLTQVVPEILEGRKLKLSSPLMTNSLILEVDTLDQNPNCKAKIWNQEVDVVHCGEEAAKWFSKLVNIDGLYLVYYPLNNATRPVRPNNILFKDLIPRDSGAFPDVTSFMMVAEDSVDKLNEKLKKKVTPLHFRPNFVLRGSEAFAEDNWRWLRFGKNGPIFKVVKPCTRCIFTTVDPTNGIKDPDMEPLKTLKTFRQLKNKVLQKASEYRPVMGIHLAFITGDRNQVNLHDNVYIGCN